MRTNVAITYIGGPTCLIEIDGMRLLTDPTFDPPGTYAGAVTLQKTAGPALQPSDLGRIDLVLLSHDQHADNLDRAGREHAATVPTLTTRAGAVRLGGTASGLAPWESTDVQTPTGRRLRITATPARHGPAGSTVFTGDVIGFVVTSLEPPVDLVYVTGDTVWYEGTADVARRFRPSIVLVFAGAARTRGPFRLTADTNEVVEFAAAFASAAIVPVHHEGWAHFTQSQDDIVKTFGVLKISERLRPVVAGQRQLFAGGGA